MAAICSRCGGKGEIESKFCNCTDGKIKKMMHEAKLKAEMARAEEAKKKEDKPIINKTQLSFFEEEPKDEWQEGDWCQYKGLICYVEDLTPKRLKICGKKMNGAPFAAREWVPKENVTRLENEYFTGWSAERIERELDALTFQININIALDTKNEELFYRLTGGGK